MSHLYYFLLVREFMRLNRIPFSEYEGYSINPKTEMITCYFKHKRYKMKIQNLEIFMNISNERKP